jgi:hypothetical protein
MHVKIYIAPQESMASVSTRALRKSDSNYSSTLAARVVMIFVLQA